MTTMVFRRTVVAAGALAACVALSSCAKKISDEQLNQLHSLKHEIASLEDANQQNDAEKSRLNGELQSETAQLNKCNDDKKFVMDKLSRWPDCWPDWHPAPPPAPADESKPEEKHKRN